MAASSRAPTPSHGPSTPDSGESSDDGDGGETAREERARVIRTQALEIEQLRRVIAGCDHVKPLKPGHSVKRAKAKLIYYKAQLETQQLQQRRQLRRWRRAKRRVFNLRIEEQLLRRDRLTLSTDFTRMVDSYAHIVVSLKMTRLKIQRWKLALARAQAADPQRPDLIREHKRIEKEIHRGFDEMAKAPKRPQNTADKQ